MPRKILILLFACFLALSFAVPAMAFEDREYDTWCPNCGTTHKPGEWCSGPAPAETPSYTPKDEPYDWSQPVYSPTTTPAPVPAPSNPDLEKKRESVTGKIKAISPFGSSKGVSTTGGSKGLPVVDPRMIKGDSSQPLVSADLEEVMITDLTQDQLLDELLTRMVAGRYYPVPKQKIFEKNPYPPLINPLRESERWKAWQEECRKKAGEEFKRKAEEQAKSEKREMVIKAMIADKKVVAAYNRIAGEKTWALARVAKTIADERADALIKLARKSKLKTIDAIIKSKEVDAAFGKQVVEILDTYKKRSIEAEVGIKIDTDNRLDLEIDKFFKRHPELKGLR